MRAIVTPEDLEAIRAAHQPDATGERCYCKNFWPCDASLLVTKVDYLTNERRLLAMRLAESSDLVSRLLRERQP